LLFQKARRAEQGRRFMQDDESWNRREISPQAPLAFERLPELRSREEVAEFWNDSAGDLDAAARAQSEREIAGEGAEHGAEHRHGLARKRILVLKTRRRDLRRRPTFRRNARKTA